MRNLRTTALLILLLMAAGCAGGAERTVAREQRPQTQASLNADVAALAKPGSVQADLWQQLSVELQRVLAAAGAEHAVSSVPNAEDSKVTDLQVSGTAGGPADFSFSYCNCGDYDQNGQVRVSDLTPIGVFFLSRAGDPNWESAHVADGDYNGLVNVADLTPIGIHYLQSLSGYELQSAPDPNAGPWSMVQSLPLSVSSLPAAGGHRLFSAHLDSTTDPAYYRVVPYFDDGSNHQMGIPSNTVFLESGMLGTPTDVTASQGTFSDHIALSWTKVVGATGYELYRDTQDTPLLTLGNVNAYDDSSVADVQPHAYYLRATDGVHFGNFSTAAIGWRLEVITTQEPPTNIQASDGTFSDKIQLSWTKAAGAASYEIYRDSQSNLLATVGDVDNYDDSSIADAFAHTYWMIAIAADTTTRSVFSEADTGHRGGNPTGTMVVLGYNDLGMHCMNQDFSELMILPPYNTLHAMLINRSGEDPQIVTSGVTVRYSIYGNTYSAGKTNFWDFEDQLFGVELPKNIGLTNHGLTGVMTPTGGTHTDWSVTGIPLTPVKDGGTEDSYQLADISVFNGATELGTTQAVVPVSWEISCNLCHATPNISTALDILRRHDKKHGTDLENSRPVVCGACHAQPELGMTGNPTLPSLSSAIHTAHSTRMDQADLTVECYACHPGQNTQCLRDIHYSNGMVCNDCHGTMADVGNPTRTPWVDEPRCGTCHTVAGHEYEQPGVLFRDSLGHHGVQCSACHSSPHAILPTVKTNDNVQSIAVQGHPGTIDTCTVCHSQQPDEAFQHFYGGAGD